MAKKPGKFSDEAFVAAFDARREGTSLANFDNLLLTDEQREEQGVGGKSSRKIFGRSPLDTFKKSGKDGPKPSGPFVEFSNEQLANELLAREAGEPGAGNFVDIETGDIYGELRLRNFQNQPAPPPDTSGSRFRVAALENLATNLDRQAEGLTPLAGPRARGTAERRVARSLGLPGRGNGFAEAFGAANRGAARTRTTLAAQAGSRQASGQGLATTTSPSGEALRRDNLQPINLGSPPSPDRTSLLSRR